jgi:hypothetical protein
VNNDWTGWSDWIAPKSETPESRNGAALLVLGAYLYLVYPGEAGKNLWCAWIDENGGHFGNIQIETTDGSGIPRTSDGVGAASDGQSLWVSFKAESSDRLCMVQSSP